LFFLLFVIVLILDNLSLFLDISAFFVILDNRLRFFNNNIRTIIFAKSIKTITLNTIVIILEHFIIERINYFVLCLVVVNKIRKIV